MPTLNGKVAVVTGAAGGIGRAIAARLAAEGAAVVAHYGNSSAEAEKLVAEIEAAGGRALAVRADIADAAQVKALFEAADRAFGRVDILVNNAGVAEAAPLDAVTAESLDRVFAVNVKGALFAAQEAARRLPSGGRVVNIASSSAEFPSAGLSVYAASKAALKAFTEVWALELAAKGVTVNGVLPGPTTPGLFDRAPDHLRRDAENATPFKRLGTADEVAAVVAFLCSEDARWVSGQHLLVNGGGRA